MFFSVISGLILVHIHMFYDKSYSDSVWMRKSAITLISQKQTNKLNTKNKNKNPDLKSSKTSQFHI